MGLFTSTRVLPMFESRAEAFDFMVAERINKGDDYAEAVERADKFADIIAKNKKLPATTPKPKNGIEKAVVYIEQIAAVKKEHPEVWELVAGGLGGLISGFALLGKGQASTLEVHRDEEIDFDKIQ